MTFNLISIIVIAAFLIKMIDGFRKGMVKEICSVVSLFVLCALAALITGGIRSYNTGKIVNVILAVILISLLSLVHHLIKLVLFSAKLVSKLPVIHLADKLLGGVFGVLEVAIAIWFVYMLTAVLDLGTVGKLILSYTADSPLLSWMYTHNYLVAIAKQFLGNVNLNILHG